MRSILKIVFVVLFAPSALADDCQKAAERILLSHSQMAVTSDKSDTNARSTHLQFVHESGARVELICLRDVRGPTIYVFWVGLYPPTTLFQLVGTIAAAITELSPALMQAQAQRCHLEALNIFSPSLDSTGKEIKGLAHGNATLTIDQTKIECALDMFETIGASDNTFTISFEPIS